MRRTILGRHGAFLLLSGAIVGCAGAGSDSPHASAAVSSEAAGEGPRRADVEARPLEAAPPAEATGPTVTSPSAASLPSERLTVHRAAPGAAEDGQGHLVQSASPIALDLDARAFPPRALDPVLTIGALRFVHYGHPHPGVLRFVVADASLLAQGEPIAVHYRDDRADEVVLVPAIDADLQRAAEQP